MHSSETTQLLTPDGSNMTHQDDIPGVRGAKMGRPLFDLDSIYGAASQGPGRPESRSHVEFGASTEKQLYQWYYHTPLLSKI